MASASTSSPHRRPPLTTTSEHLSPATAGAVDLARWRYVRAPISTRRASAPGASRREPSSLTRHPSTTIAGGRGRKRPGEGIATRAACGVPSTDKEYPSSRQRGTLVTVETLTGSESDRK